MKVILLEDIYNHGVAGEVVEVAPGFARNYLIPRGKAARATKAALESMEELRQQAEQRRAQLEERMGYYAKQIETLTLYFPVRASEGGKLYGSVTTAEIAAKLEEAIGLEVDRRRVGDSPLRSLGEYPVLVRLDGGTNATVNVVLYREGEPQPGSEPEAEMAEEAVEEVAEGIEAGEEAVADMGAEDIAPEDAVLEAEIAARADAAEEAAERIE